MSPDETRHHSQFPLRLPKSLREAAKKLAFKEGISLNHFISLAVAEKVSRAEHQAELSSTIHASEKEDGLPQPGRPTKLV